MIPFQSIRVQPFAAMATFPFCGSNFFHPLLESKWCAERSQQAGSSAPLFETMILSPADTMILSPKLRTPFDSRPKFWIRFVSFLLNAELFFSICTIVKWKILFHVRATLSSLATAMIGFFPRCKCSNPVLRAPTTHPFALIGLLIKHLRVSNYSTEGVVREGL